MANIETMIGDSVVSLWSFLLPTCVHVVLDPILAHGRVLHLEDIVATTSAALAMNMVTIGKRTGIEAMSKAGKASANEMEVGVGAWNEIPKDTEEEAENVPAPALHLHPADYPMEPNLFLNRIISRRAMSLGFG